MSEESVSKGVLDETYAAKRERKPELVFRYKVRARVVRDAATRFLSKRRGLRLLDFGPAEGLTLLELSELLDLEEGLGVEYSEALLQQAPPLPANLRLVQGDVGDLPGEVEAQSYDIVSALALLEHLPDPYAATREAARALRPGGLFVATCPNPFWDHVSTTLGLLDDEQHEMEMDRARLEGVVREAGMEAVSFERFMWAPVGVLPYARVPVSPDLSLRIDRAVRKAKVFDWAFVNQCVIGRKPS